MKRILVFAMCLLLLGTILSGCSYEEKTNNSEDENFIKIGAVLPLTGDVATFGLSSKNAIDLAVREWNDKGGLKGKKVKVIYKDDKNIPANSADAVQELISVDKVVALIGSASSECSIAMGPIATANKIPMISPNSTSPKVTVEGGEYVFRACYIDLFQGTVLAKFSKDNLKAKTAAILFDIDNDYSKGLAEFFQQGFEGLGGKIVAFESYKTGDTNFSTQLTQIKAFSPDVLLLADYYNPVGLIAKQAREKGIKSVFIGGDGWDSAELYKLGGISINGGYFSNHYSIGEKSSLATEFRKNFEGKYKTSPDGFSALSYDSAYILLDAILKAEDLNGPKIKDALKATDMEVVTGKITFDESRNPIKAAVIEKVVKNQNEFIVRINP